MEVDALLTAALAAIPRAQVAALIDLPSGMFLAVLPQPDDTTTLDLFAASVKELYAGELADALQLAPAKSAGAASAARINVFVISGDDVLQVMVRMQAQPDLVLAVCCPASVNIGMSLVKARHLAATAEIDGV
jgi:predicted regulator of Ras-like GTPase activity (Roadblock/LC7/MglB family)